MTGRFLPTLISARVSARCMNPGDTAFVTLYWQADCAAPEEYRFELDVEFGHQRRPENRPCDACAHARALPSPTRWRAGDVVAVTVPWRMASDWSGSFRLSARISDGQRRPVAFIGGGGREVLSQYIGDVDVSWNLGRPWVDAHGWGYDVAFSSPAAHPAPPEPAASFEIGESLAVELRADRPELLALRAAGGRYPLAHAAPRLKLRHRASGQLLAEGEPPVSVACACAERAADRALYRLAASVDGEPAGSCAIALTVAGETLRVEVFDVAERNGYELLAVEYPSLVEMGSGYLVSFFGAGRLIPIEEATPLFFVKRYDTRNAAALYDDKALLLVESGHMDSLLITGVAQVNGRKRGLIGGAIALRMPAQKPGLASIPVSNPPSFTVEAPALRGETPNWRLAARLMRRGLAPGPRAAQYRGAYVYKQLATYGPMPGEAYRRDGHPATQNLFRTLRFDQIAENVRALSNLTDGMRQVIYIAGWQEGGFDSAFPEPYGAEERCGGLDGLRAALEDIRAQGALCGLHDNFDDIDATRHPDYPYAAIDEWGRPWRGWIWAGGQTHIMGFSKYVRSGEMERRIQKMMELLPLKDTYHIDVLTAEPCRYDFDPDAPSSAEDSFRAKMAIVDAFARRGVDVTSEMLTHRAVGKIGYALHTRMDVRDPYIPGSRFIPLVQMIYHGLIGYSAPSATKEEMLWGLLVGAHTFHEEDVAGPHSVSRYYIQNLPAMLLDGRPMTDFRREGARARAEFGTDSWVEADFERQRYAVVVDGACVGRDFTTFARGPKGYLAYSFDGRLEGYPRPVEFAGARRARLVPLTARGDGDAWRVPLPEGALALDLPPMTPVRVEPA